MLPIFSFGQPGYHTIYGESLWRNQSYGVSNHQFDIENYITAFHTNYPLDPDPVTGSCPYEFYSTYYMPLYDDYPNDPVNTLKIRPYSVNNASDYRNGVTTLDLYAIQAHLLNSPSFESRTPTEDFPFRYISGDADYDHDVDEDDIDMIQDLILYYRDDLTRNSWEWVHKDEVEDAEERFEEEPYEFVIDYNWPGSDGIILAENSTNEILADNDKYFTFRTTKIGDITAVTNQLVSSLNSWVCGSGAYFTGGDLETRSARELYTGKIRGGSIVSAVINLENLEDIYSLEIPIYFNEADFTLIGVKFAEDFSPKWYRNPEKGSFILSDYSNDLRPLHVPIGSLVEFELKANRDISKIEDAIYWYPQRSIELIGVKETALEPQVNMEIQGIQPPDLYAEIRRDISTDYLVIESPKDCVINITIYNNLGQRVHQDEIDLLQGSTIASLPVTQEPGMYLCQLHAEGKSVSLKWLKY